MTEFLDAVAKAFNTAPRRPAVFDREIRQHVGRWRLGQAVPATEVLTAFADHSGFTNASNVIVPLHEAESAELTGEYIEYRPGETGREIVYYDFSSGDFKTLGLDQLDQHYPAWRLRFWHPEYSAPTPPSFVFESATTTEPDPVEEDPVQPVRNTEREDEIFRELRWAIEQEREAERERNRDLYGRLRSEMYLEECGGIPHLEAVGMDIDEYGQQAVKLRQTSADEGDEDSKAVDIVNDFDIYPGNEVIVDCHKDVDGFPVEAEVLDISGRVVALGIYWNRLSQVTPAEEVFEQGDTYQFRIGGLMNPVPYDRELEAIETIENTDRKRSILQGSADPRFEQTRAQEVRESRLNRFQYKAAQQALRAEDVYCIHGPPGTGKTRTLVELIIALAKQGKRVLVCAHSNQAVDNLLVGDSTEALADRSSLHYAAQTDTLTVARIGDHVTSSIVEAHYTGEDRYQSDVVCATTSGAATFSPNLFDVAVLDEASQASIPASMIPYSRAEQMILAGDHKQLPPFSSTEQAESPESEPSMFEELIGNFGTDVSTTLRTQYRMNRAIAEFSNRTFYDGVLMHGSKNRDWTLGSLPPLVAFDVDGAEQKTPSQSYYNEAEASAVAAEVKTLLDNGAIPGEIGVITAYSGQIGKIQRELSELSMKTEGIKVSTVDAFQGSEREAIVVSFVRSNETGATGFLTFVDEGPRRLNVALTRARKRLALVGDFDTLSTIDPAKHSEESAADVYAALREFLSERDVITRYPET